MWIGSKDEFCYYKNEESSWLFNIGGSLTQKGIWNIVTKAGLKVLLFEKLEKIYPLQKYRLILTK